MKEAWGYVDPGSGYVFLQNTSFFWGLMLGLFALFLWPLRFILGALKRFRRFFIIIAIILIAAGITAGVIMHKNYQKKKVVVIGIDAMDARITEEMMRSGKLPNFSYLKERGAFSPLATTNPAESVVAWSSFATGLAPGEHGIFDFIMRDPSTYIPYLSFSEISSKGPKPQVERRIKGMSFWDILGQNRIPSYIYFCPNTFPAQKVYGRMLSGMGTTDVTGTMGKFSFYTTAKPDEADKESRGRVIRLEAKDGKIKSYLYGPRVSKGGQPQESEIPMTITLLTQEQAAIEFQGKRILLEKGRWSSWQKLDFSLGLFQGMRGIAKFYLKSLSPDFQLYVTPINLSPEKPYFPISYPNDLSRRLATKVGLFYTQGMPHDTWALTEGRLDEKAFLEHVEMVFDERSRVLKEELKGFGGGLFFFYFDTLDALQHMFWRYTDALSPLYEPGSVYKDVISGYYQKIDALLGQTLKGLDEDTTLIVLSDHGFGSFRRAVHLNRWLLENGFQVLSDDKREGREFFEDVDWPGTKAYALGFGGIYLNKSGREKYGIVPGSEAEEVKKEIAEGLLGLTDPLTGEAAVKEVYFSQDIFNGPYRDDAPDLFVGFNPGFRASWQTALGGAPQALIEDNRKKWSGDHLIDPHAVPGVIFSNKKTELSGADIVDIAPTILRLFGLKKPKEMPGKELL